MYLKEIDIPALNLNDNITAFIGKAKVYYSSGQSEATTVYIAKDRGYYLKISKTGTLRKENSMTEFLYNKGLSAKTVLYESSDKDYMITKKIEGDDGTSQKYLEKPKQLTEVFAKSLLLLHIADVSNCPYSNLMSSFCERTENNFNDLEFSKGLSKYTDFKNKELAFDYYYKNKHQLENNTLIHGDYCLPNIIFKEFDFKAFIDLGLSGIGDKHYDIFWALWTMNRNFKTKEYNNRFLDCYGRNKIDLSMIKLCSVIATYD